MTETFRGGGSIGFIVLFRVMNSHQCRFINQQRKPDKAIKFDKCDDVKFFLSFFQICAKHHSRVHVHRLVQRNEKMYMHFIRFLFCNGDFQNARPRSAIALIAVLFLREAIYKKTFSRHFSS